MLNRRLLIWFVCAGLSLSPNLAFADNTGFPEGAEQATTLQASELMMKAPPLFKAGRKDEAVFWYYAGQLRARALMNAYPDQDPSGGPALFAALFETIGPEINGWAFGDIPQLQRTIASVLEWDRLHPDSSIPAAAKVATRSGLEKLSRQIGQDADQIRRERAANGLLNR
ncbi:hypothetical protein [Rhizobium tumorigenes]|uniref:hypothetical protein n=1 Tax=Rhizobium tumorigenes TaxID=2041385 RepID=UPI00241E34F6|nr:hypothetical protein [Rhizobium tumorigenes]WFS01847.1 hypothetical protein PR016_04260 [Rhizobium tumorigenes]